MHELQLTSDNGVLTLSALKQFVGMCERWGLEPSALVSLGPEVLIVRTTEERELESEGSNAIE